MLSFKRNITHFVDHIGEDEEAEGIVLQPQLPWEGSDRDYEYEEVTHAFAFRVLVIEILLQLHLCSLFSLKVHLYSSVLTC